MVDFIDNRFFKSTFIEEKIIDKELIKFKVDDLMDQRDIYQYKINISLLN